MDRLGLKDVASMAGKANLKDAVRSDMTKLIAQDDDLTMDTTPPSQLWHGWHESPGPSTQAEASFMVQRLFSSMPDEAGGGEAAATMPTGMAGSAEPKPGSSSAAKETKKVKEMVAVLPQEVLPPSLPAVFEAEVGETQVKEPAAEAVPEPPREEDKNLEPELPQDPRAELPQDPRAELPQDPRAELPQDPRAELPQDPRAELPQDPRAELPQDPRAELPQDPLAELPAGPGSPAYSPSVMAATETEKEPEKENPLMKRPSSSSKTGHSKEKVLKRPAAAAGLKRPALKRPAVKEPDASSRDDAGAGGADERHEVVVTYPDWEANQSHHAVFNCFFFKYRAISS